MQGGILWYAIRYILGILWYVMRYVMRYAMRYIMVCNEVYCGMYIIEV